MLRMLWHGLDIIIVAAIIYRLILLIKGTRAMHVLWGLILLAFITLSAGVFDLKATSFLLTQFWLAGIVLLVIVFQPEIRAGLAELGTQPLGNILVSREFDFIKELMDAVRYCMENRIGLIVVLAQDTGLRDVVKTGTPINGEVSKELLISIFTPKSPLHDGAVIVAENRLIAAGCILPLTQEHAVSKIFGMRHRAALGMAETSDAIVLVVSEERGELAVVRGGRIQTPVLADDTEKRLLDLYRSKAEKSLLRKTQRG
ncbi:MAG: diadenylate cyclase CdaA [Elusimicrobiales bacterium]|nr:diadenylate cyclase CdaA [Elusimicrobiales bacterium]